ncbi:transporter [Arachidicoccus ginsenosidimutans]|uniref:TolC family protein n=1 Tax=Arachidicoccus sp. BS20 TaxID=1850526 RepID=UPI0007F13D8E|nr:TolC family protein [Arachidicoccus sp. BS20]ANI89426.1 transporter [Arachidicoccus sp. BS20]
MIIKKCFITCLLFGSAYFSHAQQILTLRDAIDLAVKNYPSIKAKNAYAKASQSLVDESKREALPNVNFSAQQYYGTVNGQYAPAYGFGGLGAASSGPTFDKQNWNSAFGSLYLANVNWDFFSFGKYKEKTKVAQSVANIDSKDYQQEIFQQQVKVSGAYLNLVAAHQLVYDYEQNLARTDSVRQLVIRRAVTGLVAGVDSSQANAQYSSAKITLIQAIDNEEQQKHNLSLLLGVDTSTFEVDTTFISKLPQLQVEDYSVDSANHPILQYYKSRIAASEEQTKYLKSQYYPTFSLVGVLQTKGSGFGNDYANNPSDYTHNYWDGVKPARGNYLLGIGVTWNITQPFRLSKSVAAQKWQSEGLQQEYNLASEQINTQLKIAKDKMTNALTIYNEVPYQITAAQDEYTRANTLYKNGLTNMVNVTQASYDLINAETNKDIANNNIWQALLLKAAAAGDFGVFEGQL